MSLKQHIESKYTQIVAKNRYVVAPPSGHEDLPTKVLILRGPSVTVLDKRGSVEHISNTHQFQSDKAALEWLNNTIVELKKSHYKIT